MTAHRPAIIQGTVDGAASVSIDLYACHPRPVNGYTLGKAVAGLTAHAKGRRLGICKPHKERAKKGREKERGERFLIEVCGRPVPATNTDDGIWAVRGRNAIDLDSVLHFLEDKFGENLKTVQSAMRKLSKAYKPQELAHDTHRLYERFRPTSRRARSGGELKATSTWG